MNDQKGEKDAAQLSLRSVTEGASIFLIGKMVSNTIGFLFNLLLTQGIGVSRYGVYSYTVVIKNLALTISNLGSDQSILKFIPQYRKNPSRRSAMLLLAYFTSFVASLVVTFLVFLFAPLINSFTLEDPLFTDTIRILSFIIPFQTLSNLIEAHFKSYEDMASSVLVSSIIRPGLKLLAVSSALLLGYSLIGVAAALVAGAVVTLVFGLWIIQRRIEDSLEPFSPSKHVGEFYNFTLPLTVSGLSFVVYKKIDLLMVGYFLASSSVGIYNIAVLLTGFLLLPLTAFNQLFPSIASKHYYKGETVALNSIYTTTNRWSLTMTIFPFLVVGVFAEETLRIFGEEFTTGSAVLIVLALAQLANSAAGPSGYLLTMTGHQYLTMMNNIVMGVLNIILNYYFILQYGIIGAAIATGSVIVLVNITKVAEVWYFERLFPYNRQYYKPALAGITAASGMLLFDYIINIYYLITLGLGAVVGVVLFTGMLLALGFEQAEKELYIKLITQR